jgi:hypothetical protein
MNTAQVIDITPGTQEAARALTVKEQATGLTITDKPSYERGKELLLSIKDLRKEIGNTFKPIIDKANQAHKEAIAQQRKVETPLIEAEGIIKNRIAGFLAEEERKRRAEEDRLRELARKEEEERRLAEAIRAEEEGDSAEAEAILEETPAFIPPPIVPRTVETGGGITMKKNWKFRIANAAKIPREYLTPDMVKIGGVVRAMKDATRIEGVEVYSEDSIAAGRR